MYVLVPAVIFILAVSLDLFACGFAYGANGLNVPLRKVLIINIIGSIMIASGLVIGYFLGFMIADTVAMWLGFSVFTVIGITKLVQWLIEYKRGNRRHLRNISWGETVILGVLLSLDGLVAGIGAAITYFSLPFIFIVIGLSLFTDPIFFMSGQYLGHKLHKKASLNLGWLSGVILLVMAVLHFFLP